MSSEISGRMEDIFYRVCVCVCVCVCVHAHAHTDQERTDDRKRGLRTGWKHSITQPAFFIGLTQFHIKLT